MLMLDRTSSWSLVLVTRAKMRQGMRARAPAGAHGEEEEEGEDDAG
jgi:hypothetical protein